MSKTVCDICGTSLEEPHGVEVKLDTCPTCQCKYDGETPVVRKACLVWMRGNLVKVKAQTAISAMVLWLEKIHGTHQPG